MLAQLLQRIERGRTDLVMPLLDLPDLQTRLPEFGARLIGWVAYYGDVSALRLLLNRGLCIEWLGADLGLRGAAFHGHWQLCEYLIERGASPDAADPETGETALHLAMTHDDRDRYDLVVRVLLHAGANPGIATRPGVPTGSFMRDARTRGETPLHRAALFGTPASVSLLLAAGAAVDATDSHGETPLAWASWARRPTEVLRPLLYGSYTIHPGHLPLRRCLLGEPDPA